MHPRALRIRPLDSGPNRSLAPLLTLPAWRHTIAGPFSVGQVRGNDAALPVGGPPLRPAAAEPDQAQGLEHHGVHLITYHR